MYLTRGLSFSFGYDQRDVPPGEERWLRVYYSPLNSNRWEELATEVVPEQNLALTQAHGAGIYALMSSTEIALPKQGWNLISYPIFNTLSVAASPAVAEAPKITETLASIAGHYAAVFSYDTEQLGDHWQVYLPGAQGGVSDLDRLQFGHGYWIYTTTPTLTLRLRGEVPNEQGWSSLAFQNKPSSNGPSDKPGTLSVSSLLLPPPAIYYGRVISDTTWTPAITMTVTARIGDVECGRGLLFAQDGEVWYAIKVRAAGDDDATASCGVAGREVTITVDNRVMAPKLKWAAPATQPEPVDLRLTGGECSDLIGNGGFETNANWSFSGAPGHAGLVSEAAHSGQRALRLGQRNNATPGFAAAEQVITVPADAVTTTLRFWYRAGASSLPPNGYAVAYLTLPNGDSSPAQVMSVTDWDDVWREKVFDLTLYRGQQVNLNFEVFNSRAGVLSNAWMYLDNVSATVCP